MALIAALLPNQIQISRLHTAVRERYHILPCDSWEQLRLTCAEHAVTIALIDTVASAGEPPFEALRKLRVRFPSVTLVLYTASPPTTGRDLFEAGRFGIDGLVLVDHDDDPLRLLALIEQAEARGVLGHVRDALGDVRPIVRDAALVAITRAHQRLSPDRLAKVLGVRRKTLATWLAAAGFPSPARLIAWGRLIIAARLLEDESRTVESVALSLDYPSGSAFRNVCQRYLQATPQQIRAAGGTAMVIAAFVRDIGAARHPEAELDAF